MKEKLGYSLSGLIVGLAIGYYVADPIPDTIQGVPTEGLMQGIVMHYIDGDIDTLNLLREGKADSAISALEERAILSWETPEPPNLDSKTKEVRAKAMKYKEKHIEK
jgi:hypothetical protein